MGEKRDKEAPVRSNRLGVWVMVALGVLVAVRAAAANLVANSRFDHDLGSWLVDPNVSWSSQDAAGNPGSGSLSIVDFGATTFAYACVPVSAGTYAAAVDIDVPQLQGGTGQAAMTLAKLSGANCAGSLLGVDFVSPVVTSGSWQHRSAIFAVDAAVRSVRIQLSVDKQGGSQFKAGFDNVFVGPACQTDATNLCLHGGRFKVTAHWTTPSQSGQAEPFGLGNDSGYFIFFDVANVELVVKVLDGCGLNQHYWVFASGLTNVEVDLDVTDLDTDQVRHYHNPFSTPFPSIQDTSALAVCP